MRKVGHLGDKPGLPLLGLKGIAAVGNLRLF
jgi:hypothetical protein